MLLGRWALVALLLLNSSGAGLRAQAGQARQQAWRRVVAVLDLPAAQREARLLALLGGEPGAELRKLALFHLGRLRLRRLAARQAGEHFAAVLRLAQPAERSLRSQAWYGLSQTWQVLDKPAEALRSLAKLEEEAADLPYGRLGRLARQRLLKRAAGALKIGNKVPVIAPRLDRGGQSRELRAPQARPSLLLFCRHDDAAGLRRIGSWLRAFRAGGGQTARVLLFDLLPLEDATPAVRRQIEALRVPALRSSGGFLDRVWLDYGVAALPHALLVGPDLSLCAKDPVPEELQRATRVLTSPR